VLQATPYFADPQTSLKSCKTKKKKAIKAGKGGEEPTASKRNETKKCKGRRPLGGKKRQSFYSGVM